MMDGWMDGWMLSLCMYDYDDDDDDDDVISNLASCFATVLLPLSVLGLVERERGEIVRDGRGVGFFNLFFDVGGVVGFFVDEDR